MASDRTHHVEPNGSPAYSERFDTVLRFHQPGLAPVSVGKFAWHIRADASPAYPNRFWKTFGYYEGLAAAATESGWCHIDPSGAIAYTQRYAWCGNFQGERCTVRHEDGLYSHITALGHAAYGKRWSYAGDYREGISVVQGAAGLSSHVDANGSLTHDRWFVDLDVFHKGFARARDERGWTHVDRHGEPVYSRRFACVEPFYNGQARVETFDGALEVIDEVGRSVVVLRPPGLGAAAQS